MKFQAPLFEVLSYISTSATFLPLVVGLLLRKWIHGYLKPLMILVVFSAIVEIVNAICSELNVNNFFVFRIYTQIEFLLIFFFYRLFYIRYVNARILDISLFLFVCVVIIDFQINGWRAFDNLSISIESLLVISYSLFFFYFALTRLLFDSLLHVPIFWICSGMLIYFAGNLLLFIFNNKLYAESAKNQYVIWA